MYTKVTATSETVKQKFTINSNTNSGDSISFNGQDGNVYSFYIKDRKDMTNEEIQQVVDLVNDPELTFESIKQQLNELIGYANEAAGNGTLLKLYEIYLYNNGIEIHEVEGGLVLNLKLLMI